MAFSSLSCFVFSFEIFGITKALRKLQIHDISYYSGFKMTKFSTFPFNQSVYVSSYPFDLIHSYVWGPSPIHKKRGSQYYVYFIDDHARYCWIYLMKHHYEFFRYTKSFVLL